MRLSTYTKKTIHWLIDLPVGGAWGRSLQNHLQQNLKHLWLDGLFASASDNIILNFVSLYILALGASEVQIGLMSSLSSFVGAGMLLLGAILAEKLGRHKEITTFFGGGFARLSVLMLIFVPMLFKGPAMIWVAIAFSVARDSFGNLSYPAWVSVLNEVVPIEGRGRYFGSRNFVMNIAGMITTLLAGKLITMFVHETGYQIALGVAVVLGGFSTVNFFKIKTAPKFSQSFHLSGFSLKKISSFFKGQPQFVALMITAAVWNFAINVSGPFFNPYMVKNLHFSASQVGFLAVVTSLSSLLVFNRLGTLSDRLGPRKVQLISMWLIPLLPGMWYFATNVWHIALINTFGGIIWAAFNLTSFNLMLNSIPKNQVPRYSALYQIMVTLSLAFGALLGSSLIPSWGFHGLLIASMVIRILAATLFAIMVKEPVKEEMSIQEPDTSQDSL